MPSDIERKFIDRLTSPEDEAHMAQHLPRQRMLSLEWLRQRRDLEKRWQALQVTAPAVVDVLRGTFDEVEEPKRLDEIGRRLMAGLSVLIEEIHHLNECAAMRRRDQGGSG